jgi:hypothetical protein
MPRRKCLPIHWEYPFEVMESEDIGSDGHSYTLLMTYILFFSLTFTLLPSCIYFS